MSPSQERTRRYGALNRTVIVAAARAIADEQGLDALTLRRVARALGTGQASIYRHVAGREELITALCDDLAAGYPLIEPGGPPRETVLRQWDAIHRHLTEHPWGPRAIASGDNLATSGQRVAAHATAQLRDLGLDARDAARAYRTLWHLLLGHFLNDHPLGHTSEAAASLHQEADFRWGVHQFLNGFTRSGGRPESALDSPGRAPRSC